MRPKKEIFRSLAFIFLALFLSSAGWAEKEDKSLRRMILEEDLTISRSLRRILYTMGIACKYDLKSFDEMAQKRWLRKNMPRGEEIDKKKLDFIFQLKELGCVDKISPREKEYDYCLILGDVYPKFLSRFEFLLKEWERGIRPSSFIFLGGIRLLDYEKEKSLISKNKNRKISEMCKRRMPQTEIEMMKFIFENSDLPKGMREVPVFFVGVAPTMKHNLICDGEVVDVFLKWKEENKPKRGTTLVISSQPSVGYHESLARLALGEDFEVEAVGGSAEEEIKVSAYLDTIARWIRLEALRTNVLFQPKKELSASR